MTIKAIEMATIEAIAFFLGNGGLNAVSFWIPPSVRRIQANVFSGVSSGAEPTASNCNDDVCFSGSGGR